MNELALQKQWRPSTTHLIAGVLVIVGILLTNVSWWFLLLTALGAFGPGIGRELGLLQDKDEFQRRAEHRAAYHAFLVAGCCAIGLVAFFRSGERVVEHPQELATLFLALLWFTWFLSSLLAYWGPQKTAFRILIAFGCVWLAFTVISNVGAEWKGWLPLLLHPLLVIPFFALAGLSKYQPRITGFLLLAVAAFFIWFFGWFRSGSARLITEGITCILFAGPLLAGGIALIVAGRGEDSEEDGEDFP